MNFGILLMTFCIALKIVNLNQITQGYRSYCYRDSKNIGQ